MCSFCFVFLSSTCSTLFFCLGVLEGQGFLTGVSALERQGVGGGGRFVLLSSCSTFFFQLGGFKPGGLALLFARRYGIDFAFAAGMASLQCKRREKWMS